MSCNNTLLGDIENVFCVFVTKQIAVHDSVTVQLSNIGGGVFGRELLDFSGSLSQYWDNIFEGQIQILCSRLVVITAVTT